MRTVVWVAGLTTIVVSAVAYGAASPRSARGRARGADANITPRATPPALPAPVSTSTQSVVDEGAKLFVAYNCADCHGAGGSGAMGPSFVDNRWRFGGSAEEVYRSIAEGRPEGMPAWGPMIPRDHIQKLVVYVRSLGEGKDLSTENFTGATVDRAGH